MNRILKRPVLQAASSSLCKILRPNAYNISSCYYPSAGGQRNLCFQIPTNHVGSSDVCSTISAPLARPLHEIDENCKSKYYGVEKARGGSDSDIVTLMPISDEKGEEMEEHKEIERGDVINLPDLLFTKNRDYLVKYSDNQRVMAEQLAGKVVVLFFVSLSDGSTGGFWGDYIRIHKDLGQGTYSHS
ncbi:hypothetical protein POM88_018133 [Heracleum sosnowskyi]|uniref:Uncharacterized protein n=1 Tax=Heracleum sosnowskyi TaxID=360622 RepID=A0AAD8MUF9_9APIA|nr:hypothetical protein POM88_018133 [Heracleum sosnowskyi]